MPEFVLYTPDKIVHMLIYVGLEIVMLYSATKAPVAGFGDAYTQSFIFTVLYGLSDEIHQQFVPGRSADVLDWFADILGALLVVIIAKLLKKYRGDENVRREKL